MRSTPIFAQPSQRRHFGRAVLLLLAVLGLVIFGTMRPAASETTLFGYHGLYSTNLTLFPKWRSSTDRYAAERQGCPQDQCDTEVWNETVASISDADRRRQVEVINQLLNDKLYVLDPVNWGLPDYWATPFQFLRRNGDCEDYAIAKYMALKSVGVPVGDMRIVVLQDLNLQLAHAILVVDVEGEPLVLDNQIPRVMPASAIRHYQPVYAVNEDGWWLYRP
jgi:predicted transglutaminase-like cysteine proteinase